MSPEGLDPAKVACQMQVWASSHGVNLAAYRASARPRPMEILTRRTGFDTPIAFRSGHSRASESWTCECAGNPRLTPDLGR